MVFICCRYLYSEILVGILSSLDREDGDFVNKVKYWTLVRKFSYWEPSRCNYNDLSLIVIYTQYYSLKREQMYHSFSHLCIVL